MSGNRISYPPTQEEFEAMLQKIQLLEEKELQVNLSLDENTQSTNKDTKVFVKSIELGLLPKPERATNSRAINRNSWVDAYHDITARKQNTVILGEEISIDDFLDWRVKWSQRGMLLFGFLSLITFLINGLFLNSVFGDYILICFGTATILCICIFCYKNVSLFLIKRLLKEPNVVCIILLAVLNFIIEIRSTWSEVAWVYGLLYMLTTFAFISMDAVKLRCRATVLGFGNIFIIINAFNIYNCIFGESAVGAVLFKYTVYGKEYSFMRRATQRSIFIQIALFSISAVYTLFHDKKMELMLFLTSNVYRKSGTVLEERMSISFKKREEEKKTSSSSRAHQNK